MAHHLARPVRERNREIALGADGHQFLPVRRKKILNASLVKTHFSGQDRFAGRAGQIVFEVFEKLAVGPEGERPDAGFRLRKLGHERVLDVQGHGQMAHQRAHEIVAGDRGGTFRDDPEELIDMQVGRGSGHGWELFGLQPGLVEITFSRIRGIFVRAKAFQA